MIGTEIPDGLPKPLPGGFCFYAAGTEPPPDHPTSRFDTPTQEQQ